MPDESVNCVITSPPYWGLRDYGTATWVGGDPGCSHKRENKIIESNNTGQKNVDGGIGDSIYKDICKRCAAKRIDKQLGLEKTLQEYINKLILIFAEVKRVLKKDGTVWVNLGDVYSNSARSGGGDSTIKNRNIGNKKYPFIKNAIPDKCLCQLPSRFSIAMTDELGFILRNENIWHKPVCMPSSVKDRFTVDFEKVFFYAKNKKYYFKQQYELQKTESYDRLNRAVSDSHKSLNVPGQTTHSLNKARSKGQMPYSYNPEGRNKRTVWRINPKPFSESHFAVFPEKLVETPIKAGCPEDGTVMDIFSGSGTVGLVAEKLNLKWVSIELNKKYCKIQKNRIMKYARIGRLI